jgi:hypothetical protein
MKTKEDFLHHHYIHDKGLENDPEYILNAMQAYSDQQLEAYKAKLKGHFMVQSCYSMPIKDICLHIEKLTTI